MERISSSILGPVCQRVFNIALEKYRLVSGVKEEIKNLRRRVERIKGLLEDAERKKDDHSGIGPWLKSLKQVLFDAEDVFDEIATADEALGRDAEDGGLLSKVRFEFFSIFTRCAIAHRVKDINKKFDDILKDNVMSVLNVSDVTSGSVFRRPRPDTSSLLPSCDAHIFGRDGEMQKIEELLLEYSAEETVAATSDSYKNVHVISVVGMGGLGKTTLVKHAYNIPAVAEYFQLKMWVCVSNYFDVERITREIIDAAASSSNERRDEFVGTSNSDVVENRLKGKLEEKRFLLVLDDVWEENSEEWNKLCAPLMYGGKGSKIIVTTRSHMVANNIAKGTPIFLKDLPSDDLWSILQNYAFDGHDPVKYPQLVIIGRQIVDKLKGSPLAAKTIGRLLNSNLDVKHWRNIMKSKTWMSLDSKNSIVPILKLSYDYLPGHLKQCFAYCSLFPEDHIFHKDELVQLWMAQQFIQSHEESMGGEYCDDLACMSLFEKSTDDYGLIRFVMHDLIHNLAGIVSIEDCLRLEDNQQNGLISDTVRHVSIASNIFDLPKIEQLCNKYENMRTLLFLRGCKFQLDPHLGNIFTKLQRLRVLGLSGCGIKELHASIGALKHLRLLDLSFNSISKLPDSLCNLHNLQVLNLQSCGWIDALPRNMSALINLRHLTTSDIPPGKLVSGIEGLGKLTALHELDGFDCARQPMKELADMGMLRLLRIESLEKVKSREDAAESRLDRKEHLDELTLKWSRGRDDHLINLINPGLEEEEEDRTRLQAEEVLDGLQPPHSSIRRLTIRNYGGSRSPSWMEEEQSWLRHSCFLRSLKLFDCKNWEVLPPLGQLPCLDSLKIKGMGRVRRIGPAFMGCCRQLPRGGFPSLQVLQFSYMKEWEEWEVPLLGTDADDGGEDDRVLPEAPPLPLYLARLRELRIWGCPKLRQLPPLPPTLTKLKIEYVGLTHLPEWWLPPSSSSSSPSSCSSSPSLSSLEIRHCRELTSLADGLLRHPLPNLVELEIYNCEGLVSLPPDTAFGHLTSLKELVVQWCPKLAWPSTCESPSVVEEEEEDTGRLPPSLESITIMHVCREAMDQMMLAIVDSRQKLVCLTYLKIEGCFSRPPPPTLRRSLPSSLQDLTIWENSQLDDETLSAWLRGLTSLRELWIADCPAVTSLPRAEVLSHLTALVSLTISRLEALSSFGGGVHCLVSLDTLIIGDCPELLDITTAADSSRPSSSSSVLPSPARSSVGTSTTTRIRILYISGSSMQQIKTLLLQCPSLQLEQLHISDCPQLTGFGDDGGDVGGELEAALLNLSGTLEELEFCRCENLRSLPPRLRCLSSLQSLRIEYCPQIRSLPVAGLPDSLRDLRIDGGHPELVERCKEGVGSDWPLISHIPEDRRRIR